MVDNDESDPDGGLQQRVDELQAQVEDLRQQVADTGQRVRHDLSKASTLPVDTFDTCDPMVEAALAESAVQIFLRHMTAIRPDGSAHDDPNDMPQPEQISQQEIDECLEAIAAIAAPNEAEIPDPLANLDEERLWILADLSCFGTGLTRHRATKEPGNLTLMANTATWTGVLGWERAAGGWTPALPAALNAAIGGTNRIGSDVINVQHARNLNTPLAAPVVAASTAVSITNNPECILNTEHVVIASCVSAHVFEVTNTPACDGNPTTLQFGAAGNAITSIVPDYETDADIMQFLDKTWYVRDTGRRRTAVNIPVYALYRRVNGIENEMIEGVEYLEVLYAGGYRASAGLERSARRSAARRSTAVDGVGLRREAGRTLGGPAGPRTRGGRLPRPRRHARNRRCVATRGSLRAWTTDRRLVGSA